MVKPAARGDVSAGFFKIRGEGLVRNKAVYIAPGVAPDGTKDILGLWIETSGRQILPAGHE